MLAQPPGIRPPGVQPPGVTPRAAHDHREQAWGFVDARAAGLGATHEEGSVDSWAAHDAQNNHEPQQHQQQQQHQQPREYRRASIDSWATQSVRGKSQDSSASVSVAGGVVAPTSSLQVPTPGRFSSKLVAFREAAARHKKMGLATDMPPPPPAGDRDREWQQRVPLKRDPGEDIDAFLRRAVPTQETHRMIQVTSDAVPAG